MESIYITPEQRFYSAHDTAKLLASPYGKLPVDVVNKFKLKSEHIFLGVLILGGFLTAVVIIAETQRKMDRKKQFVNSFQTNT